MIGTLTDAEVSDGDPCVNGNAPNRSITSIRDLANAVQEGLIHFDLHGTAFPAGELRGQVEPLSRVRVRVDDDD